MDKYPWSFYMDESGLSPAEFERMMSKIRGKVKKEKSVLEEKRSDAELSFKLAMQALATMAEVTQMLADRLLKPTVTAVAANIQMKSAEEFVETWQSRQVLFRENYFPYHTACPCCSAPVKVSVHAGRGVLFLERDVDLRPGDDQGTLELPLRFLCPGCRIEIGISRVGMPGSESIIITRASSNPSGD